MRTSLSESFVPEADPSDGCEGTGQEFSGQKQFDITPRRVMSQRVTRPIQDLSPASARFCRAMLAATDGMPLIVMPVSRPFPCPLGYGTHVSVVIV